METNHTAEEPATAAPAFAYPMLVRRVQAIFVDSLVLIGVLVTMNALVEMFPGTPGWLRGLALYGWIFLYEPLLSIYAFTLGQYVTGIRVRRAVDPGVRINLWQSYVRFVVKVSLGWLSFVTIHANPKKRALHDLASGSVMIRLSRQNKDTALIR
ncbi:MAG TPA: RDD family protein [Chitinophagales bacterium]|nr:RDD family protein [Chitinophagales bacterium]